MEKKKKIAALSAVMYILKNEENNIKVEINNPNAWILQSRQNIMQNRALLQRRLLRR